MPPLALLDLAPDVPLPREGKVLMLTWRGREVWLVSVPGRHRYHNQMLAAFCAEEGIAHRWASESELAVEDDGLDVLGGGRYRVEGERQVLWDDSHAYGRFPEVGLAERLASAGGIWGALAVEVR